MRQVKRGACRSLARVNNTLDILLTADPAAVYCVLMSRLLPLLCVTVPVAASAVGVVVA